MRRLRLLPRIADSRAIELVGDKAAFSVVLRSICNCARDLCYFYPRHIRPLTTCRVALAGLAQHELQIASRKHSSRLMLDAAPPLVYLDSNDYSTLSDPRRNSQDNLETREALRHLAATNRVQFAFSGVHLSEMAPLQSGYTSAAAARADLLVELCGRRAFVSFDRLLKLELSSLVGLESSSREVLSTNAEWFPELGEILSPFHWETTANEIDTAVKERGNDRQQRRQLNRRLFKAKAAKPELRSWLAAQDPRANLDEILRLYPMRPEDAGLIWSLSSI